MTYRLDYPFSGIGNTAVIPQSITADHPEPQQGIVYFHDPVTGRLQQVEHAPSYQSALSRAERAEEFYISRGFSSAYRACACIVGRCLQSGA